MYRTDPEVIALLDYVAWDINRRAQLSSALDAFLVDTPEYEIARTLIDDGWEGTAEELVLAAQALAHE